MSEHFTLVETAPGLHAAIAGRSGAAVGNAVIIDTGTKTVVVDTFMTAQAAAELRTTARDVTGRDAFLVVNTHWHADHTGGNQVFDDRPIVATPRTVELIVAHAPADLDAYEAEIDGHLNIFRGKLGSEDEAERALAARRVANLEQIKEAAPGFRLTLPQLFVDDDLIFDDGRRVEVTTHGPGHTESDAFVWLPSERALVAGDLCWNAIHPKIDDGDPRAWTGVLERLHELEPRTVIPGHGRPGGLEIIEAMTPYIRRVAGLLDEVRAGADPNAVTPPAGSEAWDGSARLHGGLAALAAR